MLKEFKSFLAKGNLLDLAVAFIMGVAFAAVVTAFTNTILGVVSFVFGGNVSFDRLGVKRGSPPTIVIPYGAFITQVVNFLIVGLVLFFVVKAAGRILPKKAAATKPCEFCKTDIPVAASRCPNCTSELATA